MYQYLAEFIGSAVFVYVVLATGNPLAIGATFALLLLISTAAGTVTINPTVTIALASAGKIAAEELVPYCIAQIMGGLVGLEIYKRVKSAE
jgi:glycerol uptake facilitator-like aquaporin